MRSCLAKNYKGGKEMNKLMGFYELKNMNLPSIPWEKFEEEAELEEEILWTVRTAVYQGDDLNLPRKVGVHAEDAKKFANSMLKHLNGNGMVIYYPYFIANKSGNINIFNNKIVIEAVKNDLWNLVTYSDREVTIIITEDKAETSGNSDFLSQKEVDELLSYVKEVKRIFRRELIEDKSILMEWSYANNCDSQKQPKGEEYLVFYEIRTV